MARHQRLSISPLNGSKGRFALIGVGATLLLAFAVVFFRVLLLPSPADPNAMGPAIDNKVARQAAVNLSQAIRYQTISWGREHPQKAAASKAEMIAFHDFLEETYPAFHRMVQRRVIGEQSLIYVWRVDAPAGLGDASNTRPVALAAHMDVVPINPGTADQWIQPPFEGIIADGAIWGRGALDDKGSLIAILEAAEGLIEAGFQPRRDIYFLFGHDEEVLGAEGAGEITKLLKQEGVQFEWILDEGSATVKDVLPGVDGRVALISIAEKGSLNLELTVNHEGGHSSAPGKETAVSILAAAIARVSQNPPVQKIDGALGELLTTLAPETPLAQRIALANLWLTGGLLKEPLSKSPAIAAMMGTTTAPTIFRAGSKVNVLPQEARAVINFRLHPRDNAADIKARILRMIDDPRVKVRSFDVREPSSVSTVDGEGFKLIDSALRNVHGEIIVAPSMTIAGTDLFHYSKIADDAYRYVPFVMTPRDIARIHGDNEKISIENLARGVMFYEALLGGL